MKMDFEVIVRTYTGAVKTIEVTEMPDEEAARAEAVGLTFGRVLSIKEINVPDQPKPKDPPKVKRQKVERQLKPGETEVIITGYNNNPLAVFSNVDIEF
jgi:hypothetical protein